MFQPQQYQLLDFGFGKKWESFCGIDVVRSCPAADGIRPAGEFQFANRDDVAVFEKRAKAWENLAMIPDPWTLSHGKMRFNLRPTPFGHLGIFCEQVLNWDWIDGLPCDLNGLQALNLFAYTGGTTIALALRGASVVHLDSAKNVVAWARENAKSSGLEQAPIRWIVDDAVKFLEREIRRGNKYDIVVADPPAIGHAGNKLTWKLDRDIERLTRLLAQVTSDSLSAVLLTCHTIGFNSNDLQLLLETQFSSRLPEHGEAGLMNLESRFGRSLNNGHFCRYHS